MATRKRIPIKIHPFFLALVGLIGWMNSGTLEGTLIWAVVIFISVLVHELGHALTAVAFGQKAEIELYGLGGVTRRMGPPLKLWQDFVVVFNGPLAGFLIFLGASQLWAAVGDRPMNPWIYALQATIYVNVFWTAVNLIPVQPLDGGQLLRIFLEGLLGVKGVKIALFLSMILSVGVSIFFFVIGAFIIGALFSIFTFENYKTWQQSLALTEEDRNVGIQRKMRKAQSALHGKNFSLALSLLEEIRAVSKKGVTYNAATELAARALSAEGQLQQAYQLLCPLSKQLSEEGLCLLQELTYQLGKCKEAIAIGNQIYRSFPNPKTAVLNALCHGVSGEVEPAVGWLQTALNDGLSNLSEIIEKREFDHIRNTPQFRSFLGTVRSQN